MMALQNSSTWMKNSIATVWAKSLFDYQKVTWNSIIRPKMIRIQVMPSSWNTQFWTCVEFPYFSLSIALFNFFLATAIFIILHMICFARCVYHVDPIFANSRSEGELPGIGGKHTHNIQPHIKQHKMKNKNNEITAYKMVMISEYEIQSE